MSELDHTRASLSATLSEIEDGHRALGLPIDEDDFEAWVIIDRLEKRLKRLRKPEATGA